MYCLLINNDFSNYPKIHQFLIFKNKKEGRIEEIYINLIDSDKYQIRYHLLSGMKVNDFSKCFTNSKKSVVYQEAIRRIFSFQIGDLIQHD